MGMRDHRTVNMRLWADRLPLVVEENRGTHDKYLSHAVLLFKFFPQGAVLLCNITTIVSILKLITIFLFNYLCNYEQVLHVQVQCVGIVPNVQTGASSTFIVHGNYIDSGTLIVQRGELGTQ